MIIVRRRYTTEIKIYANNRIGLSLWILPRIFTERADRYYDHDSPQTSKQGTATITMSFDIHGVEELQRLVEKLRQVEGVMDIERTTG